jgi:methylphosphotriester-DNA--protein-cysteine methyltransferase
LVRTAQQTGRANFTLPLHDVTGWRVNGVEGVSGALFLNLDTDETEILARERRSLIGSVPLESLLWALHQHTGQERAETELPSGLLQLPAAAHRRLLRRLGYLIRAGSDEMALADALAEAIAAVSPAARLGRKKAMARKTALVRHAQRLVAARGAEPGNFAELCTALSVSPPTLNAAFRQVTGQPPARYFTLARLSRAREMLQQQSKRRGAVKNAALSQGFRELGRFSALYREVHGELPSETLMRHR